MDVGGYKLNILGEGVQMELTFTVFLLMLGVSFMAASSAILIGDEFTRLIFHTMRMQGLTAKSYWLGTFCSDLPSVALLVFGFAVSTLLQQKSTDFRDIKAAGFFTALFFLFMLNTLLWSYFLCTQLPRTTSQLGFIGAVTGFIFGVGLVLPLAGVAIAQQIHSIPGGVTVALPYTFPGALFQGMRDYAGKDPFSPGMISLLIVEAAWLVFPIIALVVWSNHQMKCCTGYRPPAAPEDDALDQGQVLSVPVPASPTDPEDVLERTLMQGRRGDQEDEDVVAERTRVLNHPGEQMLYGLELKKKFGLKKTAVRNVTFGVQPGECFGLLGPNGAGKTTTCKMMLFEIARTSGRIRYPLASSQDSAGPSWLDSKYFHHRLGVCQQVITLWDDLTATEHMEIALRVRLGKHYKKNAWKEYIQAVLQKVELTNAGNKGVGAFSGGMKRKLQVAMAIYTGALCCFLDEPSTGMDPFARRALWTTIQSTLSRGCSLILTTHSMEEAQAVCSRIAIVTKGTMRCIGSTQHLKSKYGSGYSITLQMGDIKTRAQSDLDRSQQPGTALQRTSLDSAVGEAVDYGTTELSHPGLLRTHTTTLVTQDEVRDWGESVDREMKAVFGTASGDDTDFKLVEVIGKQRCYGVKNLTSLSKTFELLKNKKAEWNVASYVVSQASSLEQIFVTITNEDENQQ